MSFIIDPQTLQQVWYSVSSKSDVGVIGTKSVSYDEFQKEVEKFNIISEVTTGSSVKNEEQQQEINNMAWESFIEKYLFIKNANKAGIYVSDEEMVAILSGDVASAVFAQNPMFNDENGTFSKERVVEFAEYVASDKDKVLNYLKKFKASLFTSEPVIDVFTGKKVADADNGYTDGKYTWFESEVHYFEHYDLKLNEDFLESVKKAS